MPVGQSLRLRRRIFPFCRDYRRRQSSLRTAAPWPQSFSRKSPLEILVKKLRHQAILLQRRPFHEKAVSELIGECEVVRPVSSTSRAYSRSMNQSKSSTNGRNFGRSSGYSNGSSYSAQGASSNSGMSEGFSYANGTGETDGETNSRATHGVSDSIQKRALVTPDQIGRLCAFSQPRFARSLLRV